MQLLIGLGFEFLRKSKWSSGNSLDLSFPTEQLGIVKELTVQRRNHLFSYAGYIEIMGRGTELPGREVDSIPVFEIEPIYTGKQD